MREKETFFTESYYPETAQKIQRKIERECDFLDYEGSRIYDKYPDRYMLDKCCGEILETVKAEGLLSVENPEEELVKVLFFQEIARRRAGYAFMQQKNPEHQ